MIFYLVSMIHAFLPEVFLFGLLLSQRDAPPKDRRFRLDVGAILTGFAGAYLLQRIALWSHATTHMGVVLPAVATGLCLLLGSALALPAPSRQTAVRVLTRPALFLLSIQAMADFLARTTDRTMTSTAVVNTELILNIGMMAGGTGVLLAVFFLCRHAAGRIGEHAVWLAWLALLSAMILWGTQVALGLLQLGSLDATGARLTFVAKLTQLAPFAPYGQLLLIALLVGLSYAKHPRLSAASEAIRTADLRKQRSRLLIERRWRTTLAVLTGVLLATMLYNDLYASLPPRLSPAIEIKPDATDRIQIKVDDVRDGKLHRYAYISGDGHRVRFFLINRYDPAHAQIGVVYDACKLCGDQGYVQHGNEIICVACNVRIFVPSIGKAGGCNPIPLPHEATNEVITIATAELEKGARYFTETVEVEVAVADPVTGAALVNLTAAFKYDYRGRMFYFENQNSYDSFKDNPEKYATKSE
ncbi:Fe-S-containing protein [Telmatospirillum sp.]|uniref:Fe-S-containing protein n=1 Tax=Telmatospirillum sp. TaxID=2079197 RepID=UPI002850602A|nr:Fe-S-containing protein [Telmatospirillum sp.]MDR3435642.1 Fe-S-containing protein [Telmatospirillum sp.]